MQLTISKIELRKVKVDDVIINIPNNNYAFKLDKDSYIMLVPLWNDDHTLIYQLDIIEIDKVDIKINKYYIATYKESLENILMNIVDNDSLSTEEIVIDYLINHYNKNTISIDEFKSIYDKIINGLNIIINSN
jgi:hypothetical protein